MPKITLLLLLAFVAIATARSSGLWRFFHERLDRDGDGTVGPGELIIYFKEMDSGMELEPEYFKQIISRVDSDGDGIWNWEEFRVCVILFEPQSYVLGCAS